MCLCMGDHVGLCWSVLGCCVFPFLSWVESVHPFLLLHMLCCALGRTSIPALATCVLCCVVLGSAVRAHYSNKENTAGLGGGNNNTNTHTHTHTTPRFVMFPCVRAVTSCCSFLSSLVPSCSLVLLLVLVSKHAGTLLQRHVDMT